jgi:hypothetical protein
MEYTVYFYQVNFVGDKSSQSSSLYYEVFHFGILRFFLTQNMCGGALLFLE